MEYLLADIIFSMLGMIYLFVWFRDKSKVRKALAEKYDNSYAQAGHLLTLLFIAWVALIGITAVILAAIYGCLHLIFIKIIR
jgi:hypothetical protein